MSTVAEPESGLKLENESDFKPKNEPVDYLESEDTSFNGSNFDKWRALIAYWILGLCNNYGYVVMLSAAHDIIANIEKKQGVGPSNSTDYIRDDENERACNEMSTGAILLADIVPALVIKFTAPFLPFYIHVRVAVCVLLGAVGYLLVAFAETKTIAIAGVVVTSLASGFGEVSYLQFSSFYSKNVVSTWSSGTGGAGILGALSYASLAELGLKTALLIMLIIPVLMAIAFWIILPKPDPKNSQVIIELQIRETEKVKYTFVESFKKRIVMMPQLLRFMIPLGLVYLFEYFINQGLFELVQFDDEFLDYKGQYHWLQVDYQLGVFISRSSVNLIHIKKIWIMSLLQLLNVAIFMSEAVFYFIPYLWIVFILTLWEGLLGGATYVNTFFRISEEIEDEKKQFFLSITSLSDAMGITLAGILALPAHNAICLLPKPERVSL